MQGADLASHKFELLQLEKRNDCFLVRYAIDGKPVDPFYEPAANCEGMKEEEFLAYLKQQSLAMKDYMETRI